MRQACCTGRLRLLGLVSDLSGFRSGCDRDGGGVDPLGRMGGGYIYDLLYSPDPGIFPDSLSALLKAGASGLPHGGHGVQ